MVSAASDPSEFPRRLTIDERTALADPATSQSIRMVEWSKLNRHHLSNEPLLATRFKLLAGPHHEICVDRSCHCRSPIGARGALAHVVLRSRRPLDRREENFKWPL